MATKCGASPAEELEGAFCSLYVPLAASADPGMPGGAGMSTELPHAPRRSPSSLSAKVSVLPAVRLWIPRGAGLRFPSRRAGAAGHPGGRVLAGAFAIW